MNEQDDIQNDTFFGSTYDKTKWIYNLADFECISPVSKFNLVDFLPFHWSIFGLIEFRDVDTLKMG